MNFIPPGSGRELPATEGCHGVHAADGHLGGRRHLDHQDLHHPQDHGAQVQGEKTVLQVFHAHETDCPQCVVKAWYVLFLIVRFVLVSIPKGELQREHLCSFIY